MKTYIIPTSAVLPHLSSSIICSSSTDEQRVGGNAVSGGEFGIGDMYIL